MTGINWVRVALGGLVAGLIVNVSGLVLGHFILGREYVEAFKAKMPPQSEMHMLVEHLSLRFWLGLLGVFVYAGFRPRFGPGPRTAAIAGATVFMAAGLMTIISLHDLGLLTGGKFWIAAAWSGAEITGATVIGASLYKEAP